jgi:hypothetical protein
MGQIEKIFILVWMIVGNILLPRVFKFPVWVIQNGKLYFSLERERINKNTHKKYFSVAYGHYNKITDKIPVLLIETSSWSKRIAYIKMNLMLIKRFDILLKKGYII